MNESGFVGAHLRWPFSRHQRPFVVRVVEPMRYRPSSHAEVFNAALTAMVERPLRTLDAYVSSSAIPNPRQFDLLTFPEAFIDGQTLCAALAGFQGSGASGCVHTGLRANVSDAGRHLFTLSEMKVLKDALENMLPMAEGDLAIFSSWLSGQDDRDSFNLGCLFLNDADGLTRVCLHPKLVVSAVLRPRP